MFFRFLIILSLFLSSGWTWGQTTIANENSEQITISEEEERALLEVASHYKEVLVYLLIFVNYIDDMITIKDISASEVVDYFDENADRFNQGMSILTRKANLPYRYDLILSEDYNVVIDFFKNLQNLLNTFVLASNELKRSCESQCMDDGVFIEKLFPAYKALDDEFDLKSDWVNQLVFQAFLVAVLAQGDYVE